MERAIRQQVPAVTRIFIEARALAAGPAPDAIPVPT
jgi:hypothetical protein